MIQDKDNSPSQPAIPQTSSSIALKNRWDHFLARIGYKRKWHRVNPGLYSIGHPSPESPVFVTANYILSFDALRSSLRNLALTTNREMLSYK
jgi:hypothetical protein